MTVARSSSFLAVVALVLLSVVSSFVPLHNFQVRKSVSSLTYLYDKLKIDSRNSSGHFKI